MFKDHFLERRKEVEGLSAKSGVKIFSLTLLP